MIGINQTIHRSYCINSSIKQISLIIKKNIINILNLKNKGQKHKLNLIKDKYLLINYLARNYSIMENLIISKIQETDFMKFQNFGKK